VKIFRFDEKEFEQEATKIKNIVVSFLYDNNLINYETYMDFQLNYGIIIKKPSFFSQLWKRKNIYKEIFHYVIVRQHSLFNKSSDLKEDKKDLKSNLIVISSRKDKEIQ